MKSFLLAAAAIIAAPAIAQEQPAPTADQSAPATTSADPAMQAPAAPTGGDTMTTTSAPSTGSTASSSSGGDPVGGYQPSTPPIQGTPAPGATVRFQQAPDPATAYPAPAAMEKYPVCKKGQYDKCIQRGGK